MFYAIYALIMVIIILVGIAFIGACDLIKVPRCRKDKGIWICITPGIIVMLIILILIASVF